MRIIKYLIVLSALLLVFFITFNFVQPIIYGSGTYYVKLSPESNSTTTYKVKAEVEYDPDFGTYFISKVFFNNGGYLTFESSYGVSTFSFNSEEYIEDDSGRSWYISLTKEKIK
ncbi:MAG: hypothetical protein RLZZ267_1394 [Bacillota bacterium]|jgi:hypothetical protein